MSERKSYAPSREKVVEEESENPRVRDNADLFIDQISAATDRADYGPNALIPTPREILLRYQKTRIGFKYEPEFLFTLSEAYGAAKRKLLYMKELANQHPITVSQIDMENMGDMFILMTATELATHIEDSRSE